MKNYIKIVIVFIFAFFVNFIGQIIVGHGIKSVNPILIEDVINIYLGDIFFRSILITVIFYLVEIRIKK
jgi:hypothetical protein